MNLFPCFSPRLGLACLVFGVTAAFGQGPLAPTGVPAPNFKTLSQLEPRTDVQRTVNPLPTDSNYEYIIDQPGSYYLSANLAVAKPSGILISASGVTLDLMGFEISRASGSGGTGIVIAGGVTRCVVRSGNVTGFADGVATVTAGTIPRGGRYEDLIVSGGSGIGLRGGHGWEILSCQVTGQQGIGFVGGDAARVRDCIANGNLGGGFDFGDAAVLEACIARGNTGTNAIQAGGGSSLTNCVAFSNTVNFGIRASFGSVLVGCTSRANTGAAATSAGISLSGEGLVRECVATANVSTNGTLTNSTGAGITVGSDSEVRGSLAWDNTGDGIQSTSRSFLLGNLSVNNRSLSAGAGLRASSSGNRIEGNHAVTNYRGIQADGTDNLILRNTAHDNSGNYQIAPDNRYGPVLNLTATNLATVNGNSALSTLGSTDVTANYTTD